MVHAKRRLSRQLSFIEGSYFLPLLVMRIYLVILHLKNRLNCQWARRISDKAFLPVPSIEATLGLSELHHKAKYMQIRRLKEWNGDCGQIVYTKSGQSKLKDVRKKLKNVRHFFPGSLFYAPRKTGRFPNHYIYPIQSNNLRQKGIFFNLQTHSEFNVFPFNSIFP